MPAVTPLYLTPNSHFWGRAAARIDDWLAQQQLAAADCCVLLPQAVQQSLLRDAWLLRQRGSCVLPQITTLNALREQAQLVAGIEPVAPLQQLLEWAERLRGERRLGAVPATRLQARLLLAADLMQLRTALIQRADDMHELAARLHEDPADAGEDASWLLTKVGQELAQDPAWELRAPMLETLRRQARALVLVDDGCGDAQAQWLLHRLAADGLPVLWLQAQAARGLGAAWLATAQGRRLPNPARASALLRRRCRWLSSAALEQQARAAVAAVLQARASQPQAAVAMVAVDRRLSRRINALLVRLRVPVLDEAGWLLSTTAAAAALPLLVGLADPDPSCDLLLDWLKQPGVAAAAGLDDDALEAIERDLREQGLLTLHAWQSWTDGGSVHALALRHLRDSRQPWFELPARAGSGLRTAALLDVARRSGLLQGWDNDAAGRALLQWLQQLAAVSPGVELDAQSWQDWINHGLERATFRPPAAPGVDSADAPPVRLLGLDDALLRPWDLCVLAGVDAGNFPPPQQPAAGLGDALATRLGLPARAALRQRQLQQIAVLLQGSRQLLLIESSPRTDHPGCSPLLQLMQWGLGLQPDTAAPLPLPLQPLGCAAAAALAPIDAAGRATPDDIPSRWSPSAYADLRGCPYRFFARRVLRVGQTDDLLPDYSKRDFGIVLHAILERFHADPPSPQQRRERLDQLAAEHWQRAGALAEPFAAVWPAVRDNYLDWLQAWQREGWQVQAEEQLLRRQLGEPALQLEGRIDRVDRGADGLFALDYKTGAPQPLRQRMQRWGEDTQLLGYGLLLGADSGASVGAGYLMLEERRPARGKPGHTLLRWNAEALAEQAAALARQLHGDWQQLQQGRAMRALGEPPLCDHCEAAVLCRLDHRRTLTQWQEPT